MNVTSTTRDVDFDNVYPAVIECFAIILSGYVAGRLNWISKIESAGLNTFVSHFALPALIFHSLSTLHFSSINWKFLGSICIAKSIIFFVVGIITLLVYRPLNYGKAGLFAIFCTQSNDFALGYPIVAALYKNTHSDYSNYLYLVAPISLVILNPIGLVMMEIEKHNQVQEITVENQSRKRLWMACRILRGVIFNPIVIMTVAGVVGNFTFRQSVPVILDDILKVLGSAFSATALFSLGLHMVGKVAGLTGKGLVIPGILIALKILILPLLIRETVSIMQPGKTCNETVDLSMFGFLYGTFPSAPGAFVIATQYGLDVDLIATAMVACTFLSAPIMFLSAKMITLEISATTDYLPELNKFLFDISITSLVCSVWVAIIMIINKKWKTVPHYATFCLIISHLCACIGTVICISIPSLSGWQLHFQFILFTFGTYGARIWGALLAINLFLLQWRSLCFVLRFRFALILLGFGLPTLIVALLYLFGTPIDSNRSHINLNFPYGSTQATFCGLLLIICLVVIIFSLILQQRLRRRISEYEALLTNDNETEEIDKSVSINNDKKQLVDSQSFVLCRGDACHSVSKKDGSCCLQDVEDLGSCSNDEDSENAKLTKQTNGSLCSTTFPCSSSQRLRCSAAVKDYRAINVAPDAAITGTDAVHGEQHDILRHTVLTLLLGLSMVVGFALCAWHLVLEEISGIYVELEFLDGALNFGQGFIIFALFGLDCELLAAPFVRRWKKFWNKFPEIEYTGEGERNYQASRIICDQFLKYHFEKCVTDIVRDRRWRTRSYKSVFFGNEFVDWLLQVGLAHDRIDAFEYATNLLVGGEIRSVDGDHTFSDLPVLYVFCYSDGENLTAHE